MKSNLFKKKLFAPINETLKEVMASGMAGSRHTPSLGSRVSSLGFFHRQAFSSSSRLPYSYLSVSFPFIPIKGPDWLSLALFASHAYH